MKVYILNKDREIDVSAKNVKSLLEQLSYLEFEVLVIDRRRGRLLTPDKPLRDDDEIEIREVMGG